MPEETFRDLNFTFVINPIDKISKELRNGFRETLSLVDKEIINYYFNIKHENSINYVIKVNNFEIGYACLVEDEEYWNLYEIYIKKEFRELGLGTRLFNYIKKEIKNKKLRTYTLPGDRTAKNFYESNRITARILIMEDKREGPRYRS